MMTSMMMMLMKMAMVMMMRNRMRKAFAKKIPPICLVRTSQTNFIDSMFIFPMKILKRAKYLNLLFNQCYDHKKEIMEHHLK